jgi:hypothetical protein
VRLGQARFIERHAILAGEQAQADFRFLERTLEEQDARQPVTGGVGEQGGMVRRLRGPDGAEFSLDMRALGVEIIGLRFTV